MSIDIPAPIAMIARIAREAQIGLRDLAPLLAGDDQEYYLHQDQQGL